MNRRNALGALGVVAAGLGAGGAAPHAEDHGSAAADKVATPVDNHHHVFCGIHVAKANSRVQIVAHHYCGPLGKMHQCLLYDGCEKGAKLLGVEPNMSVKTNMPPPFSKLADILRNCGNNWSGSVS